MKRLTVNFPRLIVQLLPPHKRQTVRIKILHSLINLTNLFNSFLSWRDQQTRLININSQVKILEGYLQQIFKVPIKIKNHENDLTGVSLLKEGQLLPVGLLPDEEPAALPLLGELTAEFMGVNFIVMIPPGVDLEALKIEIEKFKLMDKQYKINIQ